MKAGRPALGCKRCGAPGVRGRELSWRGLCRVCGPARSKEEQEQLHAHSGPHFNHWREKHVNACGGLLPEQIAQLLEERM